jgi:hypothetical protein
MLDARGGSNGRVTAVRRMMRRNPADGAAKSQESLSRGRNRVSGTRPIGPVSRSGSRGSEVRLPSARDPAIVALLGDSLPSG